MRWLLPLALALALVAPADAEDFYQHPFRTLISQPVTTCTPAIPGVCAPWVKVFFRLPEFALLYPPMLKPCPGGARVVIDHEVGLVPSGANWTEGVYGVTVSDRGERSQTWCVRLSFVTMPGLYRALEAYEEEE